MEERTRVRESLAIKPPRKTVEDQSLYGSIGKYICNKQTAKWQAVAGGVFMGHLTEGKVVIDQEETCAQQLAEFNARISVRFCMPEGYIKHSGQILLTVDCFTSRALHSADLILNGVTLLKQVEV